MSKCPSGKFISSAGIWTKCTSKFCCMARQWAYFTIGALMSMPNTSALGNRFLVSLTICPAEEARSRVRATGLPSSGNDTRATLPACMTSPAFAPPKKILVP